MQMEQTKDSARLRNISLRDEIERCAKCGQCRTVCPVFAECGVEMMVARGRISLAQAALEGSAAYTHRLKEYIHSCINCLRCAANCPSGVSYERILQEMRFAMFRHIGISPLARAVFRIILPHRWLFDLAIRTARFGQFLLPGQRQGQMRHLPLFFAGKRWVPSLARHSALRRFAHSPSFRGSATRRIRVALFMGCLINYVYPEIAEATIAVLERLGAEVIVPARQLCCGTPVLSFGDVAAAQHLAQRNAESLLESRPDFVVTACASCGRTLRSDYEWLIPGGKDLSGKVLDISECLTQLSLRNVAPLPRKVTYHDPCHLRWGQKVVEPPRQLLRQCANFVEMNEAERCCGGGGSFSLFHYDLAVRIAARKLESIAASGADIVATNCPGCMLHLADRLTAAGNQTSVVHTIQIVEEATRKR